MLVAAASLACSLAAQAVGLISRSKADVVGYQGYIALLSHTPSREQFLESQSHDIMDRDSNQVGGHSSMSLTQFEVGVGVRVCGCVMLVGQAG